MTWAELRGFALAGGCAYAADLALFVWLRGPLGWDSLTAKALSFAAGCSVAYAGNALGTYRQRAAEEPATARAARAMRARATVRVRARQYAVFLAVNVAGALVQLLCVATSHYGLGLTSPRADIVSGAVIGMALATCLRFWGTRALVFRPVG